MLNLLIAHRNLKKSQELQNYISIYIPDIRVGFISADGTSTIKALNKHHFDIVLLDFELPSLDGFDIFSKISKPKKHAYKDSFIVLTEHPYLEKKLKSEYYAFDSLPSNCHISEIINKLAAIVYMKQDKLKESVCRNKIITELQYIGYNLAHQGTHYIAETIYQIHSNYADGENLSKNIYPLLCEKYNKTLNTVKCNITSATDCVYKNVNPADLQRYFKFSDDIKPTTKMVINTVLQKI